MEVLGKHTDYGGGRVLVGAVDRSITARAERTGDLGQGRLSATTALGGPAVTLNLLRRFDSVKGFVRYMNEQKRPIGQICHAGWVLISANILDGVNVTSTPGIKDDMENAGAIWHDEPVVVDGHIVSSRRPPDLPDYMRAFIDVFAKQ